MSEYFPDKWKIVKITSKDSHYRVFGCWYGGFAGSDSWRMNSGIVSVTEVDNTYIFKGDSGSEYYCKKNAYGASGYGASIISKYINDSDGKFESLDEMPDIMNMNWQLTSEEQNDG
jgi:V8-like Glu-specific endopeptidase